MPSTAADAEVDVEALVGETKRCECRPYLVSCPNPAAWLYRHQCCGGQTFVCNQCRAFHVNRPDIVWQCRWCKQIGTVPELVKTVIAI